VKVLVTGSNGFIGKNLIPALPKDWKVDTFDITDTPIDGIIARPHQLNIQNYNWVIHLGALSSTTETDVNYVMNLNLMWSIELAELCSKYGVNLQWSSSASVYGSALKRPMREDDLCDPKNLYAMSKFLFEQYITHRPRCGVYQGFRYFNVYGPHEQHKGSQASPYTQFAKQAKETGVIKVFEGSENYLRDFVHVDTVVDYHIKMITSSYPVSGIFNIGSGTPRSFLDVARDVALLYDAKIETIPFPPYLIGHYQKYTWADMSKIRRVLEL
jgi:ADP-L-glycero-D-manno-heptose 6-epimerase